MGAFSSAFSAAFDITPIINIEAEETPTFPSSGYELCDRSGRKAYPGELVQDPYTKMMVLPKYIDFQFETRKYRYVRSRINKIPELDDQFISTIILPEDL